MPDNLNLTFAFGLTPENAVQYFLSKGYALSYNWNDVWQEQHSKAFTVAKMMQLDLLRDIKSITDEFVSGKMAYFVAKTKMMEAMQKKGWWGKQKVISPKTGLEEEAQLGSAYRIKKILETNANVAYSAGRYKTQIDASGFAPYWRYIDMDDKRVRFKHHQVGLIFKNAVLHYSHPFWNIWYPPNDWGCRCRVQNYTAQECIERGYKILTFQEFEADLAKRKIISPAKEWAYNPGLAFSPDLTKYPQELIDAVGLKI